MCGALVGNSGLDEDEDSKIEDECYISQPFSNKDQIEPWNGLISWQLWMYAPIK